MSMQLVHGFFSGINRAAIAFFRPFVCQLLVDSSKLLREALIQGLVDLALLGDEADTSGLISSPFYQVAAVCIVPATHPLARKSSLTIEDLREVPLVVQKPVALKASYNAGNFEILGTSGNALRALFQQIRGHAAPPFLFLNLATKPTTPCGRYKVTAMKSAPKK